MDYQKTCRLKKMYSHLLFIVGYIMLNINIITCKYCDNIYMFLPSIFLMLIALIFHEKEIIRLKSGHLEVKLADTPLPVLMKYSNIINVKEESSGAVEVQGIIQGEVNEISIPMKDLRAEKRQEFLERLRKKANIKLQI